MTDRNNNLNAYCPECAHDLYPQDGGGCFECGWDPGKFEPNVHGCDGCTDPDCGFHEAVDPHSPAAPEEHNNIIASQSESGGWYAF